MLRKLATLPSGRRGKWIVLALWAVLLVPSLLLAGKLGDVQENDNSAWLPGDAESTAVVERAERFQPTDTVPALVVYDRPGGVTDADLAKARADAEAFRGVEKVTGQPRGPVRSDDGEAIQTVVQIQKDRSGWDGINKVVEEMTEFGEADANGLGFHITGPAGLRGRLDQGLRRRWRTDGDHGGRRGPDPAAHLPQPRTAPAAADDRRLSP